MISFKELAAEGIDTLTGYPAPKYYPAPTANCPGCGRFAKSSSVTQYDGNWNQIYQTTYCKQCGDITESLV